MIKRITCFEHLPAAHQNFLIDVYEAIEPLTLAPSHHEKHLPIKEAFINALAYVSHFHTESLSALNGEPRAEGYLAAAHRTIDVLTSLEAFPGWAATILRHPEDLHFEFKTKSLLAHYRLLDLATPGYYFCPPNDFFNPLLDIPDGSILHLHRTTGSAARVITDDQRLSRDEINSYLADSSLSHLGCIEDEDWLSLALLYVSAPDLKSLSNLLSFFGGRTIDTQYLTADLDTNAVYIERLPTDV